jgi:hypothetical protein
MTRIAIPRAGIPCTQPTTDKRTTAQREVQ